MKSEDKDIILKQVALIQVLEKENESLRAEKVDLKEKLSSANYVISNNHINEYQQKRIFEIELSRVKLENSELKGKIFIKDHQIYNLEKKAKRRPFFFYIINRKRRKI